MLLVSNQSIAMQMAARDVHVSVCVCVCVRRGGRGGGGVASSLDTLLPGVLADDAILGKGSVDWVLTSLRVLYQALAFAGLGFGLGLSFDLSLHLVLHRHWPGLEQAGRSICHRPDRLGRFTGLTMLGNGAANARPAVTSSCLHHQNGRPILCMIAVR